jgi:hypothetical protein
MLRMPACPPRSLVPAISSLLLLLASALPSPALAHLSLIRQGADSRGSIEAGDEHGRAVAVGDFNRDGYDDVAMGAPGEDVNATTNAGSVVVCFGSFRGVTHVGAQLLTPTLIGQDEAPGARFGEALASGDFNNDLYDDLVIGAPEEDVSGQDEAGRFYVVYGGPSGLGSTSTAYSQTIAGGSIEAFDHFGASFAVGRFNGDAYDDLAVGAPGEDNSAGAVAVNFLGGAGGLTTASASFVKQTAYGGTNIAGDQFGFSLAAGHIMGTTHDDLAVGTPFRNPALAAAGVVYVVQGGTSGLSTTAALVRDANDTDSFQASGHYGYALSIGFFHGGSFKSLAVGEPGRTVNGSSSAGRVLVLKGALSGPEAIGARILNQNSGGSGTVQVGDRFGEALAAGDFWSGDGFDDLAVGSPKDGLGSAFQAGQVQVFPGSSTGPSGSGWSSYNQQTCNDRIEDEDHFGACIAYGRFDATDRGGFVAGAPGEGYEKVYGVSVPIGRDDSGIVHVLAPWRQTFGLTCQHSAVYDCFNNLVFSQEPFEPVKIASTTKIMTVLLACERIQQGFDPDTEYVVPDWVSTKIGGSQVPLVTDETLSLIDLMYLCLMLSGNDAAHAIGDVLHGPGDPAVTTTAFVAAMNARAAQLGMTRTHFNNPAGLDKGPMAALGDPYSTAEDMAKLSRAAMANPMFAEIAGTLTYTWNRDFSFLPIFQTTVTNFYENVLDGGVPFGNGIKGGCTKGAQLTGCFSSQPPVNAPPVITTTMTTPLTDGTCPTGNAAYVSDASKLVALGVASCNAPFVPLPALDFPFKLIAPYLSTQQGQKQAVIGEMISRETPVVDLFRQEGTGAATLNLEIGHLAEFVVEPGGTSTFGITPFTGHGPIVLTNQDSIPHIVEVTRSTNGVRTRYPVPAFGSITIPTFSGPPITGFTMAVDNPDLTPVELTVEIPYRYQVTSPGPSAAPFFTARPRRPDTLSDVLTLTGAGASLGAGSTMYAVAHAPSVTVDVPSPRLAPGAGSVSMRPAFPNPFRERTRIAFDLPTAAHAALTIFDVAGRTVRRAEAADLPAGPWGFDWDGRNDHGARVAAGVYFYRLTVAGEEGGKGQVVLTP